MNPERPRAIIADDEPHLVDYLAARLGELWPELQIVGRARNGLEALALLTEHEPDIAFLDIRMPGLTGLQVAERVAGGVHIVFVTAYDDHAVDAFDREAVDYLVKPVSDERLTRAIARLRSRLAAADRPAGLDQVLARLASIVPRAQGRHLRWLRASKGDTTYQIPVEEILFCRAEDKYTAVRSREAEYLIRVPISELARELDPEVFWQIHRSTLVNMNHVSATRRDESGRLFVRLRDHAEELPVSRAYAHLFRQM